MGVNICKDIFPELRLTEALCSELLSIIKMDAPKPGSG
jgi:hypothetical protein